MYDEYSFYIETSAGYTLKILFEILLNCLTSEVHLKLLKQGIKILDTDSKSTTLANVDLKMQQFDNYKVDKEITIAVNLKQLHKLIKNVKKKDFLILFINKKEPAKLGIIITPSSTGTGKKERMEESFIGIREVVVEDISIYWILFAKTNT